MEDVGVSVSEFAKSSCDIATNINQVNVKNEIIVWQTRNNENSAVNLDNVVSKFKI
jgi:hypothetical protein